MLLSHRLFPRGVAAAVVLAVASVSFADTVVLKNGDTLHGKIGQITPASLKFNSDSFGDVSIPLEKVTRYKIDTPAVIDFKDKPQETGQVSGEGKQLKVDDKPLSFDGIKSVNPPPEKWTGALLANFALARGNTNKFTVGVDANAALRRDNYRDDDRTTLIGQYNFGQSGTGEDRVTDTDNYTLGGKYDRFWTEKFYGYVGNKLEHDRVADLYFRDTPNLGLGYQWVETPKTNFFTEAGFGYVIERYDDGSDNNYVSVRLAYHFEHAVNDSVSLFHNLEYLPAVNDPGDYNLNTDAGVKVKLTDHFIGQLKVEYKRDSTPSDDALKNDVLFLVGVGWQF